MSRKKGTPVTIPVGTPTLLNLAFKWSGFSAMDKLSKRKSGFKTGKGYRKTGFKKGGKV